MSGTGRNWFGTKTCFLASNREVLTTYPGGWVGRWWVGGWYELKIRLNSASVEVEVEAELGNKLKI